MKSVSALHITPTGALSSLDLGTDPPAALVAAIGHPSLTATGLGTHLDLWHDTDGIYRRDPQRNHAAIAIARRLTGQWRDIYGAVVLAARTDSGLITTLSYEDKQLIHAVVVGPDQAEAS